MCAFSVNLWAMQTSGNFWWLPELLKQELLNPNLHQQGEYLVK